MEKPAITLEIPAETGVESALFALRSRVGRASLRLRLVGALNLSIRLVLVLAAVALLAVIAIRIARPTALTHVPLVLAAAIGLALTTALGTMWRRTMLVRSRSEAAERIDLAGGLGSALRVALELAAVTPRSPFFAPHVTRTAARLAHANITPQAIAPWRWPRALLPALALLALAFGIARWPVSHAAPMIAQLPLVAPPPEVALDSIDRQRVQATAAELAAAATQLKDAATAARENELSELANKIADERISHAEAFAKLNELQAKLDASQTGVAEKLRAELQKKAAAAASEKVTEQLAAALKNEDLDAAKAELEKLAAAAEARAAQKSAATPDGGAAPENVAKPKDDLTAQERAQLARALDKMNETARERKAQEQKDQQRQEELKNEQRRLQKELAKKPDDEELKRKLQRNQRELDKLEREQQERKEAQRQLERLERDMQQAAEQLRSKMSPEALKKAAEQMQQMQNEIRKLMAQGKLQMQLTELREVLRRSGQKQNGQGEQGQKQKGKGSRELLDDFNKQAGGKNKLFTLGGEGKPGMLLPLPMPGQPGNESKGGGDGEHKPGDGIGDDTDPNLLGDKTRIDSRRVSSRAQGKEGAGESRSQTIVTSAQRGFASTAYRRAYGDYSSLAETALEKEDIPPGYRYYVKRYFELIKPR